MLPPIPVDFFRCAWKGKIGVEKEQGQEEWDEREPAENVDEE